MSTKTTDAALDLWFARSSQGYGGKGAKPTGYEHHRISVIDGCFVVKSEVAFRNFGDHRYEIESDQARGVATFSNRVAGVTVETRRRRDGWRGEAAYAGSTGAFTTNIDDAYALPSVAARFLPVAPRGRTGDRYIPIPEDGHPFWKPPGPGSWFPVMGVSRSPLAIPRTIVDRGEDTLKVGRAATPAVRFDHVTDDGAVVATTWLDRDGAVARYEQPGCVLVAITREEARGLEPPA